MEKCYQTTRITNASYVRKVIPIEFLIIHYSAGSWQHIKSHFENGNVSAHFIIDSDGTIDEVIPTLTEGPYQGKHAGLGTYNTGESSWRNFPFNQISIGIELINYNGNIFNYSDEQYLSLSKLILLLKNLHPKLKDADRVVGHEHIAGYRGKADPGHKFDWQKLFCMSGYDSPYPRRNALFPERYFPMLRKLYESNMDSSLKSKDEGLWDRLSALTERITYLHYNCIKITDEEVNSYL